MPDTTAAPPTPPPEPEPDRVPSTPAAPVAPASKAGRGLIAASTVLAWLAVLLFLGALLYLVVPVSNQPVQHCGAPGLFLLHGTQDAPLQDTQGNPVHGLGQKQLQHAFDHRCSVRVADRAAPAAVLGAGFAVTGFLALVLGLVGHRSARRGDLQAWTDAHAAS
jgi:hypothetical protein